MLTGRGVGSGGEVAVGTLSGVGVTVFSAVGEIVSVAGGGVSVTDSSTGESASVAASVAIGANVAAAAGSSSTDSIDGNSKSEHAARSRPTNSNRRILLMLLSSTAIITLLYQYWGRKGSTGWLLQPARA